MSRKKVGVFCLFLFFTFFIIVPKVEATEEMKTKFTVTPVLPENQVSGTSSYYDLILAPKQSSTIVLDIKNKTDEKLSIVLTLANASTNDNGLIVYNDFDKPLDSSLKVPLTDLVTLENEEVSVPPHQTVSAKMKVKGLDKPIKGVVLGGVYEHLKDEKTEEENQTMGLTSRYGFNVAIAMRSAANVPLTEVNQLKLAKVTPTIALGAKSLKAVIQNPYAAIFPEVRLEGQVIKKGSSKKIAQRTLKNVRFAPNSSMNFHLDLGKQPLDAGTYIFTGRAILQQDEQRSWPFQQEFTINTREAKKLNQEATVKWVLPTWWLPTFYTLLVITIGAIYSVIWRNNYQKTSEKESENNG